MRLSWIRKNLALLEDLQNFRWCYMESFVSHLYSSRHAPAFLINSYNALQVLSYVHSQDSRLKWVSEVTSHNSLFYTLGMCVVIVPVLTVLIFWYITIWGVIGKKVVLHYIILSSCDHYREDYRAINISKL